MKVVVVVLSWNKPLDVIACIGRVRRLSGATIDIVVVDNASKDDSVARIRRAHPDVTVLEEQVNRGYAGGVNRGLVEADRRGADFAWLLNDDTDFDGDVIETLLRCFAAHPSCGLLTPALRDLGESGAVQFGNGLVEWTRGRMGHNYVAERYEALERAGATPIVPGTALFCDMRAYRAIGPLDERFFAYWEDTDFAVRASRAGFHPRVAESAVVRHAAPHTDDRPLHYHYYMVRNEALFWHLHARAGGASGWKRSWLSRSFERVARHRDLGRPDAAHACIDGIWHAWRHRYGPRDNHAPAPSWLRRAVVARPYLLSRLALGDLRSIATRLARSRRSG